MFTQNLLFWKLRMFAINNTIILEVKPISQKAYAYWYKSGYISLKKSSMSDLSVISCAELLARRFLPPSAKLQMSDDQSCHVRHSIRACFGVSCSCLDTSDSSICLEITWFMNLACSFRLTRLLSLISPALVYFQKQNLLDSRQQSVFCFGFFLPWSAPCGSLLYGALYLRYRTVSDHFSFLLGRVEWIEWQFCTLWTTKSEGCSYILCIKFFRWFYYLWHW